MVVVVVVVVLVGVVVVIDGMALEGVGGGVGGDEEVVEDASRGGVGVASCSPSFTPP